MRRVAPTRRGVAGYKTASEAMYSKDQKAIFAQSRYSELDIDLTAENMTEPQHGKKGILFLHDSVGTHPLSPKEEME